MSICEKLEDNTGSTSIKLVVMQYVHTRRVAYDHEGFGYFEPRKS